MNLLAIIIATVVGMGVGALWYSPRLFGTRWMHERKLDPKKVSKESVRSAYIFTALGSLVTTIVLGQIIRMYSTDPSTLSGGLIGLLVGIGIVTPIIATNHLFENRSQQFFLITAGHHVFVLFLKGLIIGLLS